MTTISRCAASGILVGGLVAAFPLSLVIYSGGKNVAATAATGLMLKAATDGKMDTAFNVLITSPKTWTIMAYSCAIGSAISIISFLGFYFLENRAPQLSEVFGMPIRKQPPD